VANDSVTKPANVGSMARVMKWVREGLIPKKLSDWPDRQLCRLNRLLHSYLNQSLDQNLGPLVQEHSLGGILWPLWS